jgi:hypothetical protein
MNFYKLKEAAGEIAAALYPANTDDESEGPRQDAERSYLAALQGAVCENEIVYRDPGSRLPIRQEGIAAFMTSHWCIVSTADLNAWLQVKGVGIEIVPPHNINTTVAYDASQMQVDTIFEAPHPASQQKPTSKQIAKALGPYLQNDHDENWLMGVLADTRNRPRLEKYKKLVPRGRRDIAVWEVGGVVLHLIESGELTRDQARHALAQHYPEHQYVLGDTMSDDRPRSATWFPDPE